jgi:hypothetical protein
VQDFKKNFRGHCIVPDRIVQRNLSIDVLVSLYIKSQIVHNNKEFHILVFVKESSVCIYIVVS